MLKACLAGFCLHAQIVGGVKMVDEEEEWEEDTEDEDFEEEEW